MHECTDLPMVQILLELAQNAVRGDGTRGHPNPRLQRWGGIKYRYANGSHLDGVGGESRIAETSRVGSPPAPLCKGGENSNA